MTDKKTILTAVRRTIAMESDAISGLANSIDDHWVAACECILKAKGRTVVTGIGKSGHVASKIAATLASTGTPAFFVHPGEASHGDLGMITRDDVVIALSNSGNTAEILTLLPLLKRLAVPVIAMTGNRESPLAKAADVHLYAGVTEEACPLDLAPTSSTTAAMVLGDALAIALLETRDFTAEDFAFSHPGGSLGRKLILCVDDVMASGTAVPKVSSDATLAEALMEITAKGLGMTTVQEDGLLLGIFTDGDLRRALETRPDINTVNIAGLMSKDVKTLPTGHLAAEALQLMEQNKITSLVVTDNGGKVSGVVHLMALLKAGIA
jgi:arabinose-5-phosphate isomerase